MLRTPIYPFHVEAGARLVEFAGWEMPMTYPRPDGTGGIMEEHRQVRASGGLFDVSHMGRLRITGRDACAFVERLCTRAIASMKQGQCRYTLFCNENGGVRDDALVYRIDEREFLIVCNASNREKLVGHFEQVRAEAGFDAKLVDRTLKTAMIAAQGPKVMEIIGSYSDEIASLKRYRFMTKSIMGTQVIVSRTGYTGEDGVEAIIPAGLSMMALKMLRKDIDPLDPDAPIKPVGLGARDTLRLEAGMALYGHELGEDIHALSCGVDFAIAIDKDEQTGPYIGAAALKKVRDEGGPRRRLMGIDIEGRRTARQGNHVLIGDDDVGSVTSACLSPTLGHPIAMAFLETDRCQPGTTLRIDTGRGSLDGTVRDLPFYKLQK